jgi:hypothetical protein
VQGAKGSLAGLPADVWRDGSSQRSMRYRRFVGQSCGVAALGVFFVMVNQVLVRLWARFAVASLTGLAHLMSVSAVDRRRMRSEASWLLSV